MKTPTIIAGLGLLASVFADNTLNIVAHQDDDLLFLSPDILHDIADGFNVRTVYVTAGDAGRDWTYWTSRQSGVMEAYALMAGVAPNWEESDINPQGREIQLYTLTDAPNVSLVFMHLPDGNLAGDGFDSTGHQSLEQLWRGGIQTIQTIDDLHLSYSRQDLIDVLTWIINDFEPDSMNSLDYISAYGTGDHSDHTTVGLFANEAAIPSTYPGTVIAYRGYPISAECPNVDGADLEMKRQAFFAYSQYDDLVNCVDAACSGTDYEVWLQRLYTSN
ncbi:hypothetical protein BJX61DRAFT_202537 [Aspergillus egyptiacus]|nr:hypothetical protein BJX61DRAFT_202537 [Aspergillus egyptiacus]